MSRVAEARRISEGYGDASSSSSSISSTSTSPIAPNGKRIRPISSSSDPRYKKASPSDVIFGKPPGRDSASRAYEALNADNSGSSGSSSIRSSSSNRVPATATEEDEEEEEGGSRARERARSSSSNAGSSEDSEVDTQMATSSIIPATSSSANVESNAVNEGAMDEDVKVLPALFEDADADDIVVLVGE
jgi:hypothetical protein